MKVTECFSKCSSSVSISFGSCKHFGMPVCSGRRAHAALEEDAATAASSSVCWPDRQTSVRSTSRQQLLADPRVWPPLSSAWRRRSPASTEHTSKAFPSPCCGEAASWSFSSRNCVFNILKCFSSWVYFTPVIHYIQRVCHSCWAEDYCTYRNYFINVRCFFFLWNSNFWKFKWNAYCSNI